VSEAGIEENCILKTTSEARGLSKEVSAKF